MGSTQFDNITITHFGKHASFMIEFEGKKIYIDPYSVSSFENKADLILITHGHYDHCANVNELKKEGTIILAPSDCAKKVSGVTLIKEGAIKDLEWVKVEAVPAYNINKPYHPKGRGVGFIINIGGVKVYHAGDTDLIPEMEKISVDIALLPIGGTFTMNVKEAVSAALKMKAKLAIPMHYEPDVVGGIEPNEFKKALENKIEVRTI